jgi:RNA polymerase sigma-70 factor (ECF subfamily)
MNRGIHNYDTSCQQEDTTLVKAFLAGESSAFNSLVLRHKDRVFNLCYRFLGEYEEANDCAQETFVKVYMSLKKFRFDANFTTWLYRIAVNVCKNRVSSKEYKRSKKVVRLDNPGNPENGTSSIEAKDKSLSPRDNLERKEKNMLIQKAIESLPDEQRAVVLLRDIEGLSYEEISNITGYNLGTVKSKLARAREKLREKLRGLI